MLRVAGGRSRKRRAPEQEVSDKHKAALQTHVQRLIQAEQEVELLQRDDQNSERAEKNVEELQMMIARRVDGFVSTRIQGEPRKTDTDEQRRSSRRLLQSIEETLNNGNSDGDTNIQTDLDRYRAAHAPTKASLPHQWMPTIYRRFHEEQEGFSVDYESQASSEADSALMSTIQAIDTEISEEERMDASDVPSSGISGTRNSLRALPPASSSAYGSPSIRSSFEHNSSASNDSSIGSHEGSGIVITTRNDRDTPRDQWEEAQDADVDMAEGDGQEQEEGVSMDPVFTCILCEDEFDALWQLVDHQDDCRRQNDRKDERQWRCEGYCGQLFSEEELKEHICV